MKLLQWLVSSASLQKNLLSLISYVKNYLKIPRFIAVSRVFCGTDKGQQIIREFQSTESNYSSRIAYSLTPFHEEKSWVNLTHGLGNLLKSPGPCLCLRLKKTYFFLTIPKLTLYSQRENYLCGKIEKIKQKITFFVDRIRMSLPLICNSTEIKIIQIVFIKYSTQKLIVFLLNFIIYCKIFCFDISNV